MLGWPGSLMMVSLIGGSWAGWLAAGLSLKRARLHR